MLIAKLSSGIRHVSLPRLNMNGGNRSGLYEEKAPRFRKSNRSISTNTDRCLIINNIILMIITHLNHLSRQPKIVQCVSY